MMVLDFANIGLTIFLAFWVLSRRCQKSYDHKHYFLSQIYHIYWAS